MNAAVVGMGNIGATVAADLLMHGFSVVAVEPDAHRAQAARDEVSRAVRFAPLLQPRLPRVDADEAMARLTPAAELDAVRECEIVIENVPEVWEVKRELYPRLDAVLAPTALLAPNSSAMPIARLAALTRRAHLVVGMHFMNPAYLSEAVEVIRGPATGDAAMERACDLVRTLQKEPVLVNDGPGYASNRISHLFMNEAAWTVHDGVADAATVDRLFRKGFGHRMGPLETADLIGLDTVANTLDVLLEAHGDPRFRCCPLLRRLVQEGRTGRKAGRGFYDYPSR